jgi:hypothetical protein
MSGSILSTVIDTFTEIHTEEHESSSHPETCPYCDLLIQRTNEEFESTLKEIIEPMVYSFVEQWDRLGYTILDEADVPTTATSIVDAIVNHPITPVRIQEELLPGDIENHPYVMQKYKELVYTNGMRSM